MKEISWEGIPDGLMILLTAQDIGPSERMHAADFRDMTAVMFMPARSFVGLTRDRGIRLGKRPRLFEGSWVLEEDEKAQEAYPDKRLNPDVLSLEVIR